ncbi:MAG: acyl-CoA thioesterase [Melioribacteraceae bacterium]|nr:acyl-CoA thioesterase [Melioribacteraceae bacterium]
MFETERIVEFGMCDSAGVLFFAKIFELSHSAYEEFILRSDLRNNYFENDELVIPIVSATSNFNKPITLHEVLKINIVVSKIGNSSFQLTTIFLDEVDKAKATVTTTHVFVDKKEFNKTEIPDEFLNLLKKNQQ